MAADRPIGARYRTYDFWPYIWLVAVLAVVAILRIRFLNLPLTREEGGFAYIGRLILEGVPPYTQAYDIKPPGIYLLYAAFESIFGGTARGIHIGFMVVNLATVAALFFLTEKWMNSAAALAAALAYGVLSLSGSVLGSAAHASQFVTFWAVAGALFLAWWNGRGGKVLLACSGLFFGLGLLMNKPAIVFLCYGFLIVLTRRREGSFSFRAIALDQAWFLGGAVAPLILAIVWLTAAGAVGKFFFLNFEYGVDFGNPVTFQDAIPQFLKSIPSVMHAFWIVWVLAGIGLVMYFTAEAEGNSQLQFLLFSLAALSGVALGFQFRPQSFVMFLPLICMLAGYCIFGLRQVLVERNIHGALRAVPPAMVVIALGFGLIVDRDYYFAADLRGLSRSLYFPNPFADAEQIGEYLRLHTDPADKVSILGSEPEILYRAGRRSATPYLFMSSFTNPPGSGLEMEQEMEAGIEHASPAYIVYVREPSSWGNRAESETYITDWAGGYLRDKYELEGMAELHSPSETRFRWGDDARSAPAGPDGTVLIFHRR